MILSIALAILQADSIKVLVVDGFVVGVHTEHGWSRPDPAVQPFSIPVELNRVGIGTVEINSATIHLATNADSSAWVSREKLPVGVFFSGAVRQPRQSRVPMQRDASMASAVQFVRGQGIPNPRPYLLNVYEVNVDDSGKQFELISAASRPPALMDYLNPGGWEAVLLRWQDKVYPLSVSFPKVGERLSQCRLRALGDFDGDGQVEFITSCTQPSLMCTTLWSFKNGKLTPVLDVSYEVNP